MRLTVFIMMKAYLLSRPGTVTLHSKSESEELKIDDRLMASIHNTWYNP